ncbi:MULTISPECIES: PAS domain S-box protein [unclassified Mesorhizobium]|uniref:PAS domain S-box protein n=1 Tax=unclassified Mesorhizobium TaxID=325217 RepID=UPI00333ACC06
MPNCGRLKSCCPRRCGAATRDSILAFLRRPESRPMGAGRDLQGCRKNGTTIPVEVGLNPLEHDGQRGALATVADISERKRRPGVLHPRGGRPIPSFTRIALLAPDRSPKIYRFTAWHLSSPKGCAA